MGLNLIGAIVVGISFIIGAVTTIIIKKKDNVIEQVAEHIIKDQTGIDIDFTPEEKEQIKQEEAEYEATEELIDGKDK